MTAVRAIRTNISALVITLEMHPSPPWRELTPRQLADLTNITVQSLANWRYRNNGPRFTQSRRSRACTYRPCDVLEWMTGTPAWRYNRDWLLKHGLIPDDATEDHVRWVCSLYQQAAR